MTGEREPGELRAAVAAGVVGSEESFRALLAAIVEVARSIFGARASSILLLDAETEELVFAAVVGEGEESLLGMRFPAGKGIAGWVLATRTPLVVEDVRKDPRFAGDVAEGTGYVPSGLMAAPLPVQPAPSTRTLATVHSGASERTIPAHAVPCPQRSPSTSSATTASSFSSREIVTALSSPPTSGWSASTPESRMHTRTPAPVDPPHAHSRVTRSGHSTGSAIRSTASFGRLHAGRDSPVYSAACAATSVTGRMLVRVRSQLSARSRSSSERKRRSGS